MTPATMGASPAEWEFWSRTLGLVDDLLPVVCEPMAEVVKGSVLTTFGKVPSRYVANHKVAGIVGWTSLHPTYKDIELWKSESDYGICLQTRRVRAFDLDITETHTMRLVREILAPYRMPVRSRTNSLKCLLLFHYDSPYSKRVLKTPAGAIELLADGNQCLVAGTHPSGVHYQWDWGSGPVIPTLSDEELEEILEKLRRTVGIADWTGRSGGLPLAGQVNVAEQLTWVAACKADPVVGYLKTHGHSTRDGYGKVSVTCPFRSSHGKQGDSTQTVYFPAGTGGFEQGHFECLDSACASKKDRDFLDAIGFSDWQMMEGFEVVAGVPAAREVLNGFGATDDDLVGEVAGSPLALPRFVRNIHTGDIKATITNLKMAVERPDLVGCTFRFDRFHDRIIVGPDDHPVTDTDYHRLLLTLARLQFLPPAIELLTAAVSLVAHEHGFDSAIDWLRSLPEWDGTPRVHHFCGQYLGCDDTPYHQAVSRYWWTAMAGRVLTPGVQADMAIIMISGQGTKKTSALKAMVPDDSYYASLSLDEQGPELTRGLCGRLLIEWEELQGMFTREVGHIKAFISGRKDILRHPYDRHVHDLPRRVIIVGTSNDETPLTDETGNRRWLPIRVGDEQDCQAIIRDRAQLWSEAAVLYQMSGVLYADAERLAKKEHRQFEREDVSQTDVEKWLEQPWLGDDDQELKDFAASLPHTINDGHGPIINKMRPFLHVAEVIRDGMGVYGKYIKLADEHRAGRILRRIGYKKQNIRIGGRQTTVWMPI